MSSYVSAELRRFIQSRARSLCEYCLIQQSDTYLGCQVDHVISEKHGGTTEEENLAFACTFCNRAKGSDIGSVSPISGEFIRFYNPRRDTWSEHFQLVASRIETVSEIGEVTAAILGFNKLERVLERTELMALGKYPSSAAINLMQQAN